MGGLDSLAICATSLQGPSLFCSFLLTPKDDLTQTHCLGAQIHSNTPATPEQCLQPSLSLKIQAHVSSGFPDISVQEAIVDLRLT